jgi:hypothetical protein
MEYTSLRQDRKVTLYAAVFAFIVSLLAGMAAKNPVGVLFLRAIISMFLFGAVIWGALYILRRYIPDLLPSEKQVSESEGGYREVPRGEGASGNLDFAFSGGIKQGSVSSGNGVKGSRIYQGSVVSEKAGKPYVEEKSEEGKPFEMFPGIKGGISEAPQAEADRIEASRYEGIPSLDHLFDEEEREFIPDIEVEREKSSKPQPNVGEYIDVGKVRIPNQPEILAKAVKKMMKENSYE